MIERNIEALKSRVIEGNRKLDEAWKKIRQIDHDSPRWAVEMEKWHKATGKLSTLCTELEVAGFTDCLYIINNNEIASEEEEREIMEKVAKGVYRDLGERAKTKTCLGSGGLGCMACPSKERYWETEWDELPSAGSGGRQRELL